jgi:septal ring factor EnvC (AmiA/AmiB activator)
MPIFFQKKKLTTFEKLKEFLSPMTDFSKPYPYIVILAGGVMVFLYISPNARSQSTEALVSITKNLSDLTESQFNKFVVFIESSSKAMKDATGKTITTLESFIKTDNNRMEKMEGQIAKLQETLKHTTFHDQQMATAAVVTDMKLGQCMNSLAESYANLDQVNVQNKIIEETLVEVITVTSNNGPNNRPGGQLSLPMSAREVHERIEMKREQTQ